MSKQKHVLNFLQFSPLYEMVFGSYLYTCTPKCVCKTKWGHLHWVIWKLVFYNSTISKIKKQDMLDNFVRIFGMARKCLIP